MYITYMAIFFTKNLYFRKKSFISPFYSTYFNTHPITLLLEILGGQMHGPSPPQILGGPPPSPPLSLRPWSRSKQAHVENLKCVLESYYALRVFEERSVTG